MTSGPVVLSRRHYAILTAAFTAFVLYGSFVPLAARPLGFDAALDKFAARMSRGVTLESRSDWAANVLLFVPLGFLAAGTIAVDHRRVGAVLALIPTMTALSAAIEFFQLWFPARTTSVNDVAAETLGGVLGVAAWLAFGQGGTQRVRAAWAGLGPGDWAAKALPFYLLFLVIAHGMPFDLTLSPWQIYHKYTSGREIDAPAVGAFVSLYPHPSVIAEKTLQHIVYFLPVGVLLARLPGDRWRRPGAVGRVFGAGLVVAGAVELVQLIVLSAGTYASDVLLGAVFVLAGWKLATWPRPIPPRAWVGGLAAWGLALIFVYWAPFDVAPDRFGERFGRGEWMPFVDYYSGNYIQAFNRILEKTLVFIPVGILVVRAWAIPVWAAGLVGAGLAGVVELGQALMTDHTASTSDVLMGAAGAAFGGLIASRLAAETRTAANPAAPAADRRFFY